METTHLYCGCSLPLASGDVNFCSKIRKILTNRIKLTCTKRDKRLFSISRPGGGAGAGARPSGAAPRPAGHGLWSAARIRPQLWQGMQISVETQTGQTETQLLPDMSLVRLGPPEAPHGRTQEALCSPRLRGLMLRGAESRTGDGPPVSGSGRPRGRPLPCNTGLAGPARVATEGGCCLVRGDLRELRLESGFGSPTRGHCAHWYPSNCRKERRKMTSPPSLSGEQRGHVLRGRPPCRHHPSARPSCCPQARAEARLCVRLGVTSGAYFFPRDSLPMGR